MAIVGEQIGEQVGARPEQPEPFLRGCLYPGLSDAAYPRANPADSEHLPTDVWHAAQVPAGVRLEFVGEVDAVRIFYRTTTANLGYRGEGAGCTFSLYRSGQKIAEEEAVLGEGVVQLPLYGEPGRPGDRLPARGYDARSSRGSKVSAGSSSLPRSSRAGSATAMRSPRDGSPPRPRWRGPR